MFVNSGVKWFRSMKIGLSLSGGGVRAAVFHLGVLRRLADENLLEAVSGISTVSGGSLVTAVIMSKAGMRSPTSAEYRSKLFPAIRHLMTTTDLFGFAAVGGRGLLKFNLRLFCHRASVLAELLRTRWGVVGDLKDLPDQPIWWINTTCLETGKTGVSQNERWEIGSLESTTTRFSAWQKLLLRLPPFPM